MVKEGEVMRIKKFKAEYFIYLFLLLTPFFDSVSFLFRESFPNASISPTTILRPIIPCGLLLYIFIKDKNTRKPLLMIGMIYGLYALGHCWTFSHIHTDFNAGSVLSEVQYVLNYSYMIALFYVLWWFYKQGRIPKIRTYLLWMLVIYIVLIYVSILTGTSSTTYIDGVGFKGWNASGNGLSALLILGFLATFTEFLSFKKKWYVWLFLGFFLFYLMFLFGTRTALFGSILVVLLYFFCSLFHRFREKVHLTKKQISISLVVLVLLVVSLGIGGSTAMKRRQNLKEVGDTMIDSMTGEVTHLTGDLTRFVQEIKEKDLSISMSSEQQQALLKTYQTANDIELSNSNRRVQQLLYHHYYYQEELSVSTVLFGTGYLNNYPELTLEMEVPAFFYNFGIVGFILYLGPFLFLMISGIYTFFKCHMKVSIDYMMYLGGMGLSVVLSCLTGYVYFYVPSMLVVVVLFLLFIEEKEKKV